MRRLGDRLGVVRLVVESPRDEGCWRSWSARSAEGIPLALDFRHPSWDGVDVRPADARRGQPPGHVLSVPPLPRAAVERGRRSSDRGERTAAGRRRRRRVRVLPARRGAERARGRPAAARSPGVAAIVPGGRRRIGPTADEGSARAAYARHMPASLAFLLIALAFAGLVVPARLDGAHVRLDALLASGSYRAHDRTPCAPRRFDVDGVADASALTARPSGESGETPPTLEISTSMRSPVSSSISTTVPTPTTPSSNRRVDDDRVPSLARSMTDAVFEQALLVLRRVVLEVLGEIAELARGLDRCDGGGLRRGPSSSASSASSASRWRRVRYSTRARS